MKYKYAVTSKVVDKTAIPTTVPELASLIKRDVSVGKWNIYNGGNKENPVKISFQTPNWTYGEHLFIFGSKREIQFLEKLLDDVLPVIPRKF